MKSKALFCNLAILAQLFLLLNAHNGQAQKICTELISDEAAQGFSLTGLRKCYWNTDRLTVKFLDGKQSVQNKVIKYANEWSKYANIKFDFVSSGAADIRISFKRSGSWSHLGPCIPSHLDQNDPTMNFGWLTPNSTDQEYSRVILHEFGHALGFVHEHQNPSTKIPWNKDAVIKYYTEELDWKEEDVESNIFAKYREEETNFSQHDKTSIMHYSIPNELTIDEYTVPWNTQLSALDKEFASFLYPFTSIPSNQDQIASYTALDSDGSIRLYIRKFDGIKFGKPQKKIGLSTSDNWRGWSWDGRTASYVVFEEDGSTRLYIRPFDGKEFGKPQKKIGLSNSDNWRGWKN